MMRAMTLPNELRICHEWVTTLLIVREAEWSRKNPWKFFQKFRREIPGPRSE